ncbi:MAG: DegT/DnrJ/EryC1/StrS family aminotransferase [Candidatus Gracilibacteria bacterium]|nr:DegT/DnrJ/EryC1/StrS family aminotransferase [Candidatus Gracilibacteria bacterium]
MEKTIITSFFTTINKDIFLRYISSMTYRLPFLRTGKEISKLEQNILEYISPFNHKNKKIISFYNARSALYHSLKMFDIKYGDEVIVQAYTCISVVNAILQTGAIPVYVDIEEGSLNINPKLLERKITSKTKAIILQHTFGNPREIEEILKIAKQNNIYILEDCAHSIGAEYKGVKLGNFGDMAIFSFGRDKVISSVNGGFMIINNSKFFDKIPEIKKELKLAPINLVLKNLVYIKISFFAKLTYDFFSFGKVLMFVSRKLKIIPEVLFASEKACADKTFFYAYPNSLAYIGLKEFSKIDFYNEHRIKLANFYRENLSDFQGVENNSQNKNIYLRCTYFFKYSDELMAFMKANGVLLGDWYRQVIAPKNVNYEKALYKNGSCLVAEKLASMTVNLPNHIDITENEAKKVVDLIGKFYFEV